MKTVKLLAVAFFLAFAGISNAQTAEEIVENYFENTGGLDAWNNINAMVLTGQAGMGPQEFPYTQYVTSDGKMAIQISLQGQTFTPQAFDGEQMWATNFQTQKAEAMDAETSANFKIQSKDMIDTFLNYKEKGYTLELQGSETVEGTDAFKILVTKQPVIVDGEEVANTATFYFDKESFVPIMSEAAVTSGPQKGMMPQTLYSDYLEAGDIYYPHSLTVKFNGQVGQTIKVDAIEINPEIVENVFLMPKQ